MTHYSNVWVAIAFLKVAKNTSTILLGNCTHIAAGALFKIWLCHSANCIPLGHSLYVQFTSPFPFLWKWVWLVRLIQPEQLLLCLHRHGLSFTLKLWASRGIPAVYEWSSLLFIPRAYLKQILSPYKPVLSRDCQTHSVDLSGSCCACCKHIQLESSSLPLSFMLTLSWLTWSINCHGQSILVKYLNLLI